MSRTGYLPAQAFWRPHVHCSKFRCIGSVPGATCLNPTRARKPSDIKTVFVEALLQRSCRPNC